MKRNKTAKTDWNEIAKDTKQEMLVKKHERAIQTLAKALLEMNKALYPTEQLRYTTEDKVRRLLK